MFCTCRLGAGGVGHCTVQLVLGAEAKTVMQRVTRKGEINFRELVDVKLPRAKKIKEKSSDNQLYDIEVLEREPGRGKIHYIGYSSRCDEWRSLSDIVDKSTLRAEQFSLHNELASRIKLNLTSSRKSSPEVKIEIEKHH